MLKGSDVFNDIYLGQVGKLIQQLNQIESWTIEKRLIKNQLLKSLAMSKYLHGHGNRNEYRLHGGIGQSLIYKVPKNRKGQLTKYRGEYIHIVCIANSRYEAGFSFKPFKKSVIDSYLLTHKKLIIASREGSGMTSCWQEYLCLTYGDRLPYKIFEGRYEALSESSDYFDEDLQELNLPEFIDGKIVTGIEDDYVVGGELDYVDEEEAVEFSNLMDENLLIWLKKMNWNYEEENIKNVFFEFHTTRSFK